MFPNWMQVNVGRQGLLSRRGFMGVAGAVSGMAGFSWFSQLGLCTEELQERNKACILLWMAGGPSQFETFDPKPGAETQGPTKAISTTVPGIQVAEHWPETAKIMKDLAIVRSMTGNEGNHGRATYLLHTSYAPTGGLQHPGFGSIVNKEIGAKDFDLPGFVSIAGPSVGPSYLGMNYAPYVVSDPNRPPDNLLLPIHEGRLSRRLDLLKKLEKTQAGSGADGMVKDHQTLYEQTRRMMVSPKAKAFDLDREPERIRDAYGRDAFGQGCLMARRLIEAGVTFVEIQSNDWDTHGNELPKIKKLAPPVDQGMSALITDLKDRNLLDSTLVIWMGEFGRTPRMNVTKGRDHYPMAFTAALTGSGIKSGQVIGATDKLGIEVTKRPVTVSDLFCTFCKSLGINPRTEYDSNIGRPVKIVERGLAVKELF